MHTREINYLLEKITELINEYIPPMFDEGNCFSIMPLSFEKSINTFLHKEVQRYNLLIKTVVTSLKDTR